MKLKTAGCVVALSIVAGCALVERRDAAYGSTHAYRSQLPAQQAARCFARNAEDHSSALASEVVTGRDGRTEVTVRVKNGVTYATADFRPAGTGSSGTITLMVLTSGRRGDLLDALTAGC